MSHTKHANTFFPGDRVVDGRPGQKTAGSREGEVVDFQDGKVKVSWDHGGFDWVDPHDVKKKG